VFIDACSEPTNPTPTATANALAPDRPHRDQVGSQAGMRSVLCLRASCGNTPRPEETLKRLLTLQASQLFVAIAPSAIGVAPATKRPNQAPKSVPKEVFKPLAEDELEDEYPISRTARVPRKSQKCPFSRRNRVVEPWGIEPQTSSLRTRRSPS
jgi:hypothetical protein